MAEVLGGETNISADGGGRCVVDYPDLSVDTFLEMNGNVYLVAAVASAHESYAAQVRAAFPDQRPKAKIQDLWLSFTAAGTFHWNYLKRPADPSDAGGRVRIEADKNGNEAASEYDDASPPQHGEE